MLQQAAALFSCNGGRLYYNSLGADCDAAANRLDLAVLQSQGQSVDFRCVVRGACVSIASPILSNHTIRTANNPFYPPPSPTALA